MRLLDLPTFLRKYEQRSNGIMWFLGAGASRASDIKTAGDMILDFKARLYRSAKGIPTSALKDIGNRETQNILQRYFDATDHFPSKDSEDEYAYYFQETYPEPQDRRRYIDSMMRGAKPSFGHMAMSHLMSRDLIRITWTTNFDRVVEDAVSKVMGTGSILTVGALGEPETIKTAISQQRWPIYAKLHGDFQSENLKNTTDELSTQDTQMRDLFLDACRNYGLGISGYSGRDASILEVLNEAINEGRGFPNGLFWFVREQDNIFEGVTDLMERARNSGIDASFVKSESFDELFSDIVRYLPQTEGLAIELDDKSRITPRKIDLTERAGKIPFLRTNAIPLTELPRTCRLINCDIGGMSEIQELLAEKNSKLIAARVKNGMIAFGDDREIKRVLEDKNIERLDTHGILSDRLKFESGERSLLRGALFSGLAEYCGLKLIRERHQYYFRADSGSPNFGMGPLTNAVTRLHGTLTNGDVRWTEACRLSLDFRLDRLWILLEPTVLVDLGEDVTENVKLGSLSFLRERRVKRYNKQANLILDGWVRAIFGSNNTAVSIGVDGGTGIGANFELLPVTGFSGLGS